MTRELPDMAELVELAVGSAQGTDADCQQLIRIYGFGVPSMAAMLAIASEAPRGVVEIGAGLGLWAALLRSIDVDTVAYDLHPPPSDTNRWFGGIEPWTPVAQGDHRRAGEHPDRTLLLVWPTKDEDWPADALEAFGEAGGERVAFVGEPPGGRTGDDRFQAMLGEMAVCVRCRYQATRSPCVCDVVVGWVAVETLELPRWAGHDDRLRIYRRAPASQMVSVAARSAPWWRRLGRRRGFGPPTGR